MKNERDELYDPRIADWLEDGPDKAPSFVLKSLGGALPSIPQRHSWRDFWRSPIMPIQKVAGLAAVAALVLLVAFGAAGLLTGKVPFFGGNPATPLPTPTALPSAAPTVAPPIAATPPVLSLSDVGRPLQSGTYYVANFAAPFAVTLPVGWKMSEFAPNSIGLARTDNGAVNVYMAIMSKAYADPCHPAAGPVAVGPSVEDLVTALSSMPGFEVTNVNDVTVGGATGKQFNITNTIDVSADHCSGDTLPMGTYDKAGEDTDIAMFGGESDTFWILDAGGTRVLMAVTDNAINPTQAVRDSLLFAN